MQTLLQLHSLQFAPFKSVISHTPYPGELLVIIVSVLHTGISNIILFICLYTLSSLECLEIDVTEVVLKVWFSYLCSVQYCSLVYMYHPVCPVLKHQLIKKWCPHISIPLSISYLFSLAVACRSPKTFWAINGFEVLLILFILVFVFDKFLLGD